MDSLVSVIIPTYNRAALLKETIDSVLAQTYPNFEILICDDGSTDNTKEMVLGYNNSKIRYFYQKNRGCPAPARNLGLKNAKGKYIAFLDSDDLWLPEKLERQISAFTKFPNIILIATNGVTIPPKKYPMLSFKTEKVISFEELMNANLVINSSVLIKREIFEKIGSLDERLEIRGVEDYDYWLRVLHFQQKSIMIHPEPLIRYREHTNNLTVNQSSDQSKEDFYLKQYEQLKLIYEKFRKDYNELVEKVLKRALIMAYSYKYQCQYYNNRISTREYLRKQPMFFIEKVKGIVKKTLKKLIY